MLLAIPLSGIYSLKIEIRLNEWETKHWIAFTDPNKRQTSAQTRGRRHGSGSCSKKLECVVALLHPQFIRKILGETNFRVKTI